MSTIRAYHKFSAKTPVQVAGVSILVYIQYQKVGASSFSAGEIDIFNPSIFSRS